MNKVTKNKALYYSTLLSCAGVTLLLAISIESSQWKSLDVSTQDLMPYITSYNESDLTGTGLSASSGVCKVDLNVFKYSRSCYQLTLEAWFLMVGGGMFALGTLFLFLSYFGVNFNRMSLSRPMSKLLVKLGMPLCMGGAGIVLAGLLAFTFNFNKMVDWETYRGLLKHVVEALSSQSPVERVPVSVPEIKTNKEEEADILLDEDTHNGWAYVVCWLAGAVSMMSGIASYFISDAMGKLSMYEFQYSAPAQDQGGKKSKETENEAV